MSETSAITLIPRTPTEARDLARELAPSMLLPVALRQKPHDVMAIILTGAELGLGPMQSIRGVHIIEGKPTLAAELMAALVVRVDSVCEYLQLIESSATVAVYETKRKGHPKPTTVRWTIAQAQAAGLVGRDNWRKYPDAMLRARCTAAICRAVYPDLVGGMYDPDEIDVTPADKLPTILSVVRGPVVEGQVTPTTEAEMVDALKASVAALPPKPTPPDYDASGAPLSERAKLEVAVQEAGDRAALEGLLERIKALGKGDQDVLRKLYMTRLREVSAKAAQ